MKMPADVAVHELHEISRSFGDAAKRAKKRLLARIESTTPPGGRATALLADTLEFLRAYPDDAELLRSVERLAARLPRAPFTDRFAYAFARRLEGIAPGSLEVEWDEMEDEAALQSLLELLALPGEMNGLWDSRIGLQEWLERVKPAGMGDLAYISRALEGSGLEERLRCHLFDACTLTLRYSGPIKSDLRLGRQRPVFQRRPIPRERFPLPSFIRRPAAPAFRGGRELLHLALQTLGARNLEIYPLIHGSEEDVALAGVGRGVTIALVGVEPAWRLPLEVLVFFMLFKNGVPVAYGPAAVFAGCCEMGINLFPEFRGGEIRFFYAQLMRLLRHRLGAEYFFLTRYGMGEDNEDAIESGAFWFYRKLGFLPTNPRVEALAREEEARRAADPGHRSDRRMLRRLSRTEAYLDVSNGRWRPLDFGRLSQAESRAAGRDPGRVRRQAARAAAARVARILGMDGAQRALRAAAPTLASIPDLASWPRADKAALRRFLIAKDARSEAEAARLSARQDRLLAALRLLSAP